jgi:hypothetical protein
MSNLTWHIIVPFLIWVTLPVNWFLAPYFMTKAPF